MRGAENLKRGFTLLQGCDKTKYDVLQLDAVLFDRIARVRGALVL